MLIEEPSKVPCKKCGKGTYARYRKTGKRRTFLGYWCDKCGRLQK